jgi:hypothetical protein
MKPAVTVQIASDTGQSKDAVQPIPILRAVKQGPNILVAYGSPVFLSFESIVSMSLFYVTIIFIYFNSEYLSVDRIHFHV